MPTISAREGAGMIRDVRATDADALTRIYNHYVLETTVSFEERAISASDMEHRIADVRSAGLPWFVAERDGTLIGYAYATRWKARSAYRFSVETSVYLAPGSEGKGMGTSLYRRLIDDLKAQGIHLAIGGIALPNPASIALHEKLGFRKVAHFCEVGYKFDTWIDVGYWQLRCEPAPLGEISEQSIDSEKRG